MSQKLGELETRILQYKRKLGKKNLEISIY